MTSEHKYLFRREGLHDAPAHTKLLGLLQSNEISAASSRTDNCHGMHLVKSFADASPNFLDILEGESRHLRLWQINHASSKRDYGSVYHFHFHLVAMHQ